MNRRGFLQTISAALGWMIAPKSMKALDTDDWKQVSVNGKRTWEYGDGQYFVEIDYGIGKSRPVWAVVINGVITEIKYAPEEKV